MSFPDYQVVVISPYTGLVTRIIDSQTWYDLRYDRKLDDIGTLVMTLPADDDLPMLFSEDTFIDIMRQSPITGDLIIDETYLVRLTQRFQEANEQRLVIGGVSLNHLIARRVVDPDDDPLAAAGYSTKAGTADEVIRSFAREQMADLASTPRQFPGLTIGLTPGTALPVGKRARYDNLLVMFQALAAQGQTDFVINRVSGNTMRMAIQPIGTDRTKTANYPFAPFTQFDPDRGNLASPSLLIDRKKEQNFCYALGQGQGNTRIVAQVAGDGIGDSPYNRIEFTQDVRQSDRSDSLYLLTGARQALTDSQFKQEFTFETIQDASGTIYQKDYFLGDRITVRWGETSVDLRVTGVEINLSSEGETISPSLEPFTV